MREVKLVKMSIVVVASISLNFCKCTDSIGYVHSVVSYPAENRRSDYD